MMRCCVGLVSIQLFASLAATQSLTTGAITGSIVDQSGAAVSGAVITATNLNTGASRTARSGSTGSYVLPQLDPGDYTVTAQSGGFKRAEASPITVAVS